MREVIITDTVEITIPKEIEQVTVKCDSSSLSNKFARSKAAICPDGSLFHTLETIEQQIKEPIASSTQVRDSIIYVERKVNNIIEVERELTSWQSLQINGFWTLFALIIVLIISLRII